MIGVECPQCARDAGKSEMIDNRVPENLDWVEVRAKCSVSQMFKALEHSVRDDVGAMNKLRPQGDQPKFSVVSSQGQFSVTRREDSVSSETTSSVDFLVEQGQIKVRTGSSDLLAARVTIADDGRCKFKVKDTELEQWQVRKMSLEQLFFEPPKN
jgi:hypothetical protein